MVLFMFCGFSTANITLHLWKSINRAIYLRQVSRILIMYDACRSWHATRIQHVSFRNQCQKIIICFISFTQITFIISSYSYRIVTIFLVILCNEIGHSHYNNIIYDQYLTNHHRNIGKLEDIYFTKTYYFVFKT